MQQHAAHHTVGKADIALTGGLDGSYGAKAVGRRGEGLRNKLGWGVLLIQQHAAHHTIGEVNDALLGCLGRGVW